MKFVNLTPHALIVIDATGTPAVFPASGTLARCATVRQEVAPVGGFRLVSQCMGQVTGVPAPEAGTTYIVSALVLGALAGSRDDVVAPDTGPDAIRESGQIVAVRGFVR